MHNRENFVVEVKDLEKTYKGGLKAVDGLSFNVKVGEIFGFLGPNGSGKTTTINILLSLINFDAGEVKIFGEPMTPSAYETKRKIGVITQEVAVFNELTVRENIEFFASLYIKDKEEIKRLTDEAIEFVSLQEFVKFRPKKLSGGLLRRLHIACGIVHQPKLIFFDEPTVGIDPQNRNQILEKIKQLNEEGATIIYTSHYMEEVEMLCDEIMIIDKGRLVARGNKEELKAMTELGERFEIRLEDENIDAKHIGHFKGMPNVLSVDQDGDLITINVGRGPTLLNDLIKYLENNNINYSKLNSETPTLNDVSLEFTGRALRD
ncbi:MAG: ABC transporter ATP-binding protein [Erysipelotrichaceae bacterium]|nr:ABC transporter ATP-binding protein [Erysipelotrichaceae bacterium]